MQCHRFVLELSGNQGIPSQAKIGQREIIKWMTQQGRGHERHLLVRNHQNRGSYLVQTNREETAAFLKTFELEVSWNAKSYRIPLKPALPNKPRFWVRIFNTCDGDFYNVDDAWFDGMLEEAGFTIVTPTSKNSHYGSPIKNFMRSAQVMRGDRHIDRDHVWYDQEGQGHKWRLIYDGQPHRCTRGCNVFHDDGKCEAWEKEKEKKTWEGQQKCFFVSSSLLKLASDTKLTRVDAIPGAKIGHVSNHVNNDATIFKQADALVIHAGANMDMGSIEKSKPHIEAQAQELGQVLGELVEAKKKVFVIDPVCGPLIKEAPGADHWAIVRSRLKKTAKKVKAEWVSLNDLKWVAEEDFASDGRHYSMSGTQKVMEAISDRVKAVTGFDIMDGMVIQERAYSGISRDHYRVGCHRCTRYHEGRECPPLPSTENPDLSVSSNTAAESFFSADSDSLNASDSPSESSAASVVEKDDADTEDSDAEPVLPENVDLLDTISPIQIESPDLVNAYTVMLRKKSTTSSRSPSAGKRELEKSKDSSNDGAGKRQCTKADSQSQKGHSSRNTAGKQSKK